jgi:hypothetical protein
MTNGADHPSRQAHIGTCQKAESVRFAGLLPRLFPVPLSPHGTAATSLFALDSIELDGEAFRSPPFAKRRVRWPPTRQPRQALRMRSQSKSPGFYTGALQPAKHFALTCRRWRAARKWW